MAETTPKMCPQCGKELPRDAPDGLCPNCVMAMNLAAETELTGAAGPLPVSPEEIAARLPQFEILELLGRGGMGVVYKARQTALDREVAIKVLAGEWQGDADFSKRFEREAKTLAQMSHPNIVTVHDFGVADGLYYIVMEYIDGVNLRDLLSDGKMEPEQALAIVPPICEALEYAHAKGVVHRDIKPENLLLDREGRVKIADFGIASLVGKTKDNSGTPSYMAPEQANGSVDRRTDIYAIGVVLYEMLTGERPAEDVVAPSKKVEVDVRIDEIVLRALEKEPERRYQTAHEFRTAAETLHHPVSSRTKSAKPHFHKTSLFYAFVGLAIAIIWGIPADLMNGDLGWFLGRIIAVPLLAGGLHWLLVGRLTTGGRGGFFEQIGVDQIIEFCSRGDDTPSSSGIERWAFGLFVTAILGTPLLLALVPGGRQEWVGVFALMCALGSIVCGITSMRTRLGRGVTLGWVAIMVSSVALLAISYIAEKNRQEEMLAESVSRKREAEMKEHLARKQEAEQQIVVKEPMTEAKPIFGPPRNVVLFELESKNDGPRFLDLDTGKTQSMPTEEHGSDDDTRQWMTNQGLDVFAERLDGRWGLVTARANELKLSRIPAEQLADITPDDLHELLLRTDPGLEVKDENGDKGWRGYFLPEPLPANLALAFRTADGALGVLSIDDTSDDAQRITLGYQLVDSSETLQPEENDPGVVVAEDGKYEISWNNGIAFEIVGVLRNPHESKAWFHPDGTPFIEPPAKVVSLWDLKPVNSPAPQFTPEDEVLVFFKIRTPDGVQFTRTSLAWEKPYAYALSGGSFPTVLDLSNNKETQTVSHFALWESLGEIDALDLKIKLVASNAEWEPVATYDGKKTRELTSNVMAVFSPPHYDKRAKRHRIDVMHNLSRDAHSLRLVAKLNDGKREVVDFHTGVLTGVPTKGFALVHDHDFDIGKVEEFVLERASLLRGRIDNVTMPAKSLLQE
jgi:predicted Ser/Thr protein kinase